MNCVRKTTLKKDICKGERNESTKNCYENFTGSYSYKRDSVWVYDL